MKNPRYLVLITITFALSMFTLGLFIGRNYSGQKVSLSFPEEMTQIPLMPVPAEEQALTVSEAVGNPLNINTASYDELLSLPGIGESIALEILSYRASNGGFSHVEELMNVSGIGEKKLEAMLHLITIGGAP